MKTINVVVIALLAVMFIAGCAQRGEVALQNANPNAYEATRGYGGEGVVADSEGESEGDAE